MDELVAQKDVIEAEANGLGKKLGLVAAAVVVVILALELNKKIVGKIPVVGSILQVLSVPISYILYSLLTSSLSAMAFFFGAAYVLARMN